MVVSGSPNTLRQSDNQRRFLDDSSNIVLAQDASKPIVLLLQRRKSSYSELFENTNQTILVVHALLKTHRDFLPALSVIEKEFSRSKSPQRKIDIVDVPPIQIDESHGQRVAQLPFFCEQPEHLVRGDLAREDISVDVIQIEAESGMSKAEWKDML